MKLVELKEYLSRTEAEMVVDLLCLNEINAVLQSDDLAGQNPGLGMVSGYQIMVSEEQLEEARAFLSAER